jgi:hypothetical protein
MGYVQAGYSIVLAILFLYAVSLVIRRHRLNRAVTLLVDAQADGQAPLPAGAAPLAEDGFPPGPGPVRTGPGARGGMS